MQPHKLSLTERYRLGWLSLEEFQTLVRALPDPIALEEPEPERGKDREAKEC